MKRSSVWMGVAAVLAGLAWTAGCEKPAPDPDVQAARSALQRGQDASGTVQQWRRAVPVRSVVLVSFYEPDGAANIRRMEIRVNPLAGEMTAWGITPLGPWQLSVRQKDDGTFDMLYEGPDDDASGWLPRAMAMLLHRIRGPLNVLRGPEQTVSVGPADVGGIDEALTRVGVDASASAARTQAYYFDAKSNRLRLITTHADTPGQEGLVSEIEFAESPDLPTLPRQIRIHRIGEFALIGPEKVLEATFSRP